MSAFFGPSEKHFVVGGGFCISVFAIEKKDGILLVKPKPHERWKEWAPNWGVYEPEALAMEFNRWRFPSSYVKEGEHPNDTLDRIITEQLGVSTYRVARERLLNFYSPSRRYLGKMHWDYCFLYDVSLSETPGVKPWFSDIRYVDPAGLKPENFGSAQGGLLEELDVQTRKE